MTSPITGPYDQNDPYNKWYQKNKKIFTLDLLIGNEDFLGKNLSVKMIQALILQHYKEADYFLIDPAKENKKAIYVYQKAGFEILEEFIPEFDPILHIMMRLEVKHLLQF